MGYSVSQTDSKFTVKASNLPAALAAATAWTALSLSSVAEALGEDGWEATVDQQTGDITDIAFQGEKMYPADLGEDDLLFHLAPFVEPGSYIEMRGEDGKRWRWLFDGTSVKIKFAKISW